MIIVYVIVLFIQLKDCFTVNIPTEFLVEPPFYCSAISKPEQLVNYIKERSIPKLESNVKDVKLMQVHTIIRHGARTLAVRSSCWKGYESQFDCSKLGEAVTNLNSQLELFVFQKQYDARPDMQLPNSCFRGQLVEEGYHQHKLNGEILAKAYFTNGEPLADLKEILDSEGSLNKAIYFRSTEYERTRMSGAQLLSAMIRAVLPDITTNPDIVMHTADEAIDTLFLNLDKCSELEDIDNRSTFSKEYLDRYSKAHEKARELANKMFDIETRQSNDWPLSVNDCLQTSICGQHDLVSGFSVADVKEVLMATSEEMGFTWVHNNSEFSKKMIARFFVEIKAFIMKMFENFELPPHTDGYDKIYEASSSIRYAPFVLWSAHDTTISPFLATFGEPMWNAVGEYGEKRMPPYASMINLEIYETPDKPMFRLVYNGKVFTQYVAECPQDDQLCPLETFFKATEWATPEEALRGCKHPRSTPFKWKFKIKMSNSAETQYLRHNYLGV